MMERQVNHMVRLVDDLLDVSRITPRQDRAAQGARSSSRGRAQRGRASRPLIDARAPRLVLDAADEPLSLDGRPGAARAGLRQPAQQRREVHRSGGEIAARGRATARCRRDLGARHGMGIPRAELPSVFDMFMQVEPRRPRAQGGLGIGLTLVKRSWSLHGGTIEAGATGRARAASSSCGCRSPRRGALSPAGPVACGGRSRAVAPRAGGRRQPRCGREPGACCCSCSAPTCTWRTVATRPCRRCDAVPAGVVMLDIGMPEHGRARSGAAHPRSAASSTACGRRAHRLGAGRGPPALARRASTAT